MAHATYDPLLVAVSVLIAIFASYTALDLANRVAATRGMTRSLWLAGGSLAMGVGIWSMHFVGMLAFRMPGMAVAYDVPLLILSVVVAIGASALALYVVSRPRVVPIALAGGGVAMGAAICGMHYIGIAGMRMPATIDWDKRLVAASIAIAVGAAYAALWLALRLRRHHGPYTMRLLAGGVMGVAISGMHYTAMAAMRLRQTGGATVAREEDVLATNELAIVVILSTILVLTVALAGSIAQRKLERQADLAETNAQRFREAERRAVEEEALRLATEEVASALTIDDVLQKIVGRALAATAADGAFVESFDHRTGAVIVSATAGDAGPSLGTRVPLEHSFSATIVDKREPAITGGREMTERSAPPVWPGSSNVATLMVVPLIEDRGAIAALILWRRAEQPSFTTDDRTRAITVTHLASLAFKRVRLLDESEKRREQLDMAERLAALGRVASTIAHEFNNVLMSIQAFHEVTRRVGTYDEYLAHTPQIERAIQRGKSVTDAVLRLTRAAHPHLQCLDLQRWLPTIRADIVSLMPDNVEVQIDCHGELFVRADASHLEQALVNLALNARDAMPDGGTLRVSGANEYESNGGSENKVHLVVSDTGGGMPEDVRSRVFEPLFTTKRGGTGLGLAIVHEIIRAHGGVISVESASGKGTAFHIYLDAAREVAIPPRPNERHTDGYVERIVLVEDDDIVAEGLRLMLEMSGLQVRRVALGRDALPAIREFQPHAVVLDVGLPDIDGVTVYRMIEDELRTMPVVFATGHADETRLAEIIRREHVTFLRKPFETSALTEAIQKAVDGAARPHVKP